MPRRRMPRYRDLRPLVRFRRPVLNGVDRRLARCLTIADLRRAGRRRTPQAVFDYVDGAAESESSLIRARDTFARLEFHPSVLRDVSELDTSVTVAGTASDMPYVLAPTGFTRMMHVDGEAAVGRSAHRHGIPYALSTMGTTSIEDLAAAAPHTSLWFQLYVWRDRGAAEELVARAKAAGYRALVLTVDVPVAGARLRDDRNGFAIPPSLTLRTAMGMVAHPRWWFDLITSDPLTFASLGQWDGTVAALIDGLFDPTMEIKDLEWLRGVWDGPIIVKGIQTVEDARLMADVGAEAVVLSNHGGRQLDRSSVPLSLVPRVRDELGDSIELLVDSGIMSGGDIIAALALGADACLVGRAYLYGLMAGGERGVDRALEILDLEVRRTMRLLGVRNVQELSPQHVSLHD